MPEGVAAPHPDGIVYRRVPRRVRVERLDAEWEWRTGSGARMTARAGDYRVWNPGSPGEAWSVSPEALDWGYAEVAVGEYEARSEVRAREVGVGHPAETVASLEGVASAHPGEWIVTDPVGRRWVVSAEEFPVRYAPA